MKNEVYLIDCMEFMKGVPDKYYELAIVDPPYGIGENGEKNHTRSNLAKSKNYKAFTGNDLQPPNEKYFRELIRVSKNQIVWSANHFIDLMPYRSSCWIVWDKLNGENDFADCELAWTNFKTAVRKFQWRWHGMLQQNMKDKEERIHPTQKPIALYLWLLNNYAKQGDKIFDSHVGSGSSRIACDKLGYYFEGCEIDKDYWEAQEKRYKNYKSQLALQL